MPPMTTDAQSGTPRTDALVSKHSDEHVSMYAAGNWRPEDAVRQARELLNHARQLERELAAAPLQSSGTGKEGV